MLPFCSLQHFLNIPDNRLLTQCKFHDVSTHNPYTELYNVVSLDGSTVWCSGCMCAPQKFIHYFILGLPDIWRICFLRCSLEKKKERLNQQNIFLRDQLLAVRILLWKRYTVSIQRRKELHNFRKLRLFKMNLEVCKIIQHIIHYKFKMWINLYRKKLVKNILTRFYRCFATDVSFTFCPFNEELVKYIYILYINHWSFNMYDLPQWHFVNQIWVANIV